MNETKNYIIGMVMGELNRIQELPYQLYEPYNNELFVEHNVVAHANMSSVPTETLRQQRWVHNHELAMALVLEIRNNFSQFSKLLLKGSPPFFDLWVDGDDCGITILTESA